MKKILFKQQYININIPNKFYILTCITDSLIITHLSISVFLGNLYEREGRKKKMYYISFYYIPDNQKFC